MYQITLFALNKKCKYCNLFNLLPYYDVKCFEILTSLIKINGEILAWQLFVVVKQIMWAWIDTYAIKSSSSTSLKLPSCLMYPWFVLFILTLAYCIVLLVQAQTATVRPNLHIVLSYIVQSMHKHIL